MAKEERRQKCADCESGIIHQVYYGNVAMMIRCRTCGRPVYPGKESDPEKDCGSLAHTFTMNKIIDRVSKKRD